MLGVSEPWALAILLFFAVGVTALTNWIGYGFPRPFWHGPVKPAAIVSLCSSLVWVLLVFLAGIIAARYMERTNNPSVGWTLFVVFALVASFARALLYRRILDEAVERWARGAIYNLVYLFSAIAFYLLVSAVAQQRANPLLFIPLGIGALLPDLDSSHSIPGSMLPFVSKQLEARLGPCGGWHSLGANLLFAMITVPLAVLIGWQAWALVSVGFLVHIVLDLLRPRGLELFWPVTQARFRMLGLLAPGSMPEMVLCAFLAIVLTVLLLTVDIGKSAPPPEPSLSYEQTLDRYYWLRGRNLVFAWVDGSWQASGRRMSGRFEVLSAVGESFILLDRYDGTIFAAGKSPADNLYISRISLSEGASIRVKPVEVHLENQHLRETLPSVYQMQSEPGLQHIYVSGDIVVPEPGGSVSTKLQEDLAQSRLRRIQSHGDGHFTLRYLTASELVELADLEVAAGDLVIVATYETPAAGPTVTPLPLPASVPEGTQ